VDLRCTPEIGQHFVRFLYTGRLEEAALDQNLLTLLELSNYTLVEPLKQRVEVRMVQLLRRENMVEFFTAGDKYNGQRVRARAKLLITLHLGWLVRQDSWREAFGDNKELVIEILMSKVEL
jgi:hypothetical protein